MENKDDWRLDSIQIRFMKGYDFEEDPEKKLDRYEGNITFENKHDESFSFRIKPNMAQRYIDLISEDIVIAANNLSERLLESLNLKNKNEK